MALAVVRISLKEKLRNVQCPHTKGTEVLHLLSKTITDDELQTAHQILIFPNNSDKLLVLIH